MKSVVESFRQVASLYPPNELMTSIITICETVKSTVNKSVIADQHDAEVLVKALVIKQLQFITLCCQWLYKVSNNFLGSQNLLSREMRYNLLIGALDTAANIIDDDLAHK